MLFFNPSVGAEYLYEFDDMDHVEQEKGKNKSHQLTINSVRIINQGEVEFNSCESLIRCYIRKKKAHIKT